ncbi:MAG: flavodoxin domain-containing protein [Pseudomonadota bacterium]
MKLSLLYGTETGTAEMLCEDLQEKLEETHEVETANLEDVTPGDLALDRFHIFVCSTYGDGELPSSAIAFVDTLKAEKTDLSALRYAVFGLGDTTYDITYNNGSVVLMTALNEAGAQVLGERGLHDASGLDEPLDLALPWAEARIAEAGALVD